METIAFLFVSLAILSVALYFGVWVPSGERLAAFNEAFDGASCDNAVERVAYAAYGVGPDDCIAYGCHLPYRQSERLGKSLASLAAGLSEISGVSATGTVKASVSNVSAKEADGTCTMSFRSSDPDGWTYSVAIPSEKMGSVAPVFERLFFSSLVESRAEAGPPVSVGGRNLDSFFGTGHSER